MESKVFADIREMESPGRQNATAIYAQTMYAHFEEIQKLRAEGFTLATICKFLEKKGLLPAGCDIHSFRRAFRRETDRRKRTEKGKTKVYESMKNNAAQHTTMNARREPDPAPEKFKAGLQVNPDNTFRIRPIDRDDLPDIHI
jgi:DNA-binding transcriptional MerR regulator